MCLVLNIFIHISLVIHSSWLRTTNHCSMNTSPQASARIHQWSLLLAAYEYTLVFRKTEAHSNADTLSRLPLPTVPAEVPTPPELVLLMEHLADSPVTADQIRSWTKRDPTLASVLQYV